MEQAHEKIAKVAYELHLKRGSGHGNDLADWLEAEKMVLSTCGKSKPGIVSKAASKKPKKGQTIS